MSLSPTPNTVLSIINGRLTSYTLTILYINIEKNENKKLVCKYTDTNQVNNYVERFY